MLTRKLWIKHGLCNGEIGFLREFIYEEGPYPPSFLNYKGPILEGCVPKTSIISSSNTTNNVGQHQLPLKLLWGITIHKSHGLTISNAVIDLGSTEKVVVLAYVVLSRVNHTAERYLQPQTDEFSQSYINYKYSHNFLKEQKMSRQRFTVNKLIFL